MSKGDAAATIPTAEEIAAIATMAAQRAIEPLLRRLEVIDARVRRVEEGAPEEERAPEVLTLLRDPSITGTCCLREIAAAIVAGDPGRICKGCGKPLVFRGGSWRYR